MTKIKKIVRSAKTEKFVTINYAKKHPNTTVFETEKK
jgi:hypothetical protein